MQKSSRVIFTHQEPTILHFSHLDLFVFERGVEAEKFVNFVLQINRLLIDQEILS